MRVAHLSDLHLLDLEEAVPFRLLNKRLTGYVNLRAKRGAIHRPWAAALAAEQIRRERFDHVVITGDLSNLALEREFERVRAFVDHDLALGPDRVSIVPGNHDAYTRGAVRSDRFARYFGPFLTSDLTLGQPGAFPYVRLRGPLAIIGLCSAVPRPPLVASGHLGKEQVRVLRRVLQHPEVRKRTPLVLLHHPPINPASRTKVLFEGLTDADALVDSLEGVSFAVLLHGHLHKRVGRGLVIPSRNGGGSHTLPTFGTTSASLVCDDDGRRGGFNAYTFDKAGALVSAETYRLRAGVERSLGRPGRPFEVLPLSSWADAGMPDLPAGGARPASDFPSFAAV